MTRAGLNIIDSLSTDELLNSNPRDLQILTEQVAATLPKEKYQFFDFEDAEKYYKPADIAKAIEQRAKKGELKVPFNFEKFKLDTKDDYNLMYQALKQLPDYMYNKDKQRIGYIVKNRIRDKAKEALDAGQIDRKTFDTLYRKARFAAIHPEAVTPSKAGQAVGETLTGMMQTAAGFVKTGADIANELGADIDTTSLDALITHYDNNVREYQHALGENDNKILTFQNLGDLITSMGVLGKAYKSTKYTAGFGERMRDYLVNGAIASGLSYVVAKGRNEEDPETAAAFGMLGGMVLSSAVHNLSKLGMSKFDKLEEALKETLQLSEDDINKAVQTYSKYMQVDKFDDLYSPKARVEAILLMHGSDIANLITKTAGDTTSSMRDLAQFVNQRKEKLFDYLQKNDLDVEELGAKINEANTLAQHLWDKVTYNIGQQLVDLPENVVKKDLIDTPLDALDDITKTKVARIKEIIQKPTIEGLMEADKVINEIKRVLKNNRAKYREWSEFQQKLSDTLKEAMPEKAYNDWIELKGMYSQIAKVRDSRIGKILTADINPEAKIQKLARLGIERGDFKALANLVGKEETAKLEKSLIKEVLTENPTKRSWQALDNMIKKQSFVTEEGKYLAQFISDMNKYFKLDDEISSIMHKFERSAGFREDLWSALKANIIGRVGLKLANTVLDIFKNKENRLDTIIYDYMSEVYKNPAKVKDFNIRLQNLEEPLIDKLRKEATQEAFEDMQGEFTKGKYYNSTHDILIENNKAKSIEDKFDNPDDFEPMSPITIPPKPNTPKGGAGNAKQLPSAVYNLLPYKEKKALSAIFRTIVEDNNLNQFNDTWIRNFIDNKVLNTMSLIRKYNYTLPQAMSILSKSIVNAQPNFAPYVNEIVKYYQNALKRAYTAHIPTRVSKELYQKLVSNPNEELQYLNKNGLYLDIFGTPKILKSYQDVEEFLKEINNNPNVTIKVDKTFKKNEGALRKTKDGYEIVVNSKKDLAAMLQENQHIIQEVLNKPLLDENNLVADNIMQVKKDNRVKPIKNSNMLGELEANIAVTGFDKHPVVDIINKAGLNLKDYFFNKKGASVIEDIFPQKVVNMYPLLQKIKQGKFNAEDLPELRKYIALRYRNPSYISNPYVAEAYGINIDYTKIPINKLSKYKEEFEKAKFFKILPLTLTLIGSGAVLADTPINYEDFIKENEGIRLMPYKDTRGYWTIGYGHKLNKEELQKYKNGISEIEAEELFRKDYGWAVSRLKKNIKNFDSLDTKAKIVLVDLAFNLGISGVLKFKKFKKAIENKDYLTAADELLDSKYANQLPARAYKNASLLRSIEVGI